MKVKEYLAGAAMIFVVAMIANLIVTYLYNLIVHGAGDFEWDSAARFAITLAVVLPWLALRNAKDKKPA